MPQPPVNDHTFSFPSGLHWLKMRWHLIHGGGGIVLQKCQDGAWRIHADALSVQQAEQLIAAHLENISSKTVLKDDIKRTITRVQLDHVSYIVKEYRKVFNASFSPDVRGWLCGNRLQGTVKCLAWKRIRNKAFIIMEDVGAQSLDLSHCQYILENFLPKIRRAAQLMAQLHQQGIFHTDLKPSNFVTKTPDSTDDALTIIDCDDVRHFRHLPHSAAERNFIQFFGGLAYAVPNSEHRRIFARLFKDEYCRQTQLPADSFRNSQKQFLETVKKLYPTKIDNYLTIQDILAQ